MYSSNKAKNIRWFLPLLLLVLPLLVFLAIQVGPNKSSPADIWEAFTGEGSKLSNTAFAIRTYRLPRVLQALMSGAVLTLGGYLMQALVRNPLADPYIMGLSAGAAFGANLRLLGIITFGAIGIFTLPLYAFFGALLSLSVLILIGYKRLYAKPTQFLLAGVAISSFFVALTGLLLFVAVSDKSNYMSVVYWSMGSLNGVTWQYVWATTVLLTVLWVFTLLFARRLDVLLLGDRQARALGMAIVPEKLIILAVTALGVGGTVAFTGPIGFVGLMVPHFTRGVLGPLHRPNLAVAPLLGGIFLCCCDVLSQLIYPSAGLPIGIVTAFVGVPFFLYLIFQQKNY